MSNSFDCGPISLRIQHGLEKSRTFDIVFPPLGKFHLNYRTCPVFGGQFTLHVEEKVY